MTSHKIDTRVRLNLSERTHARLSAIAKSREMGLADYCVRVLEGVDDDFVAYHAYNASKHSTLAVYILMVMLQIDRGKQIQSEVAAQLGKLVHAAVGHGPAMPRFDGDLPEVEPDVFVEALMDFYSRFAADRFPDLAVKKSAP
jgi:hypothetical protein